MSEEFNKDAWIKLALARKCIACNEAGEVFRNKGTKEAPKWIKVALQTHKKSGRVYFNLQFMGITKSVLVNRLVCLRFHPNPLNLPEGNHMDGDKQNNRKDNLEWSSRSDQEKHAFATGLKSTRGSQNSNAKLTVEAVTSIRHQAIGGRSLRELAKDFDVSPATIRNVVNNKTWQHI